MHQYIFRNAKPAKKAASGNYMIIIVVSLSVFDKLYNRGQVDEARQLRTDREVRCDGANPCDL